MVDLKVGDKILNKADGEVYEIKNIVDELYDSETFEEVTMLIVQSHEYDSEIGIRYSEDKIEKVEDE